LDVITRLYPLAIRVYTEKGAMREFIKQILIKLGLLGFVRVVRKTLYILLNLKDYLRMENPPGHYYSPLPSTEDLRELESAVFKEPGNPAEDLRAIDLNEQGQLQMLDSLKEYYSEFPSPPEKKSPFRYYYMNGIFGIGDAIIYYSFLRHLRPKRIIEIGSGFTSALLLDINDLFLDRSVEITFIEPYPERLHSLLSEEDRKNTRIINKKLQHANTSIFETLQDGDILFIDSSHVLKANSDVIKIFSEVLPRLKDGVYIHIHDVFYPFEYPMDWLLNLRRSWNEAYGLKAFLQYNKEFRIEYFIDYMYKFHRDLLKNNMPLVLDNPGCGIWLRKI
jgi:hypothetical protein